MTNNNLPPTRPPDNVLLFPCRVPFVFVIFSIYYPPPPAASTFPLFPFPNILDGISTATAPPFPRRSDQPFTTSQLPSTLHWGKSSPPWATSFVRPPWSCCACSLSPSAWRWCATAFERPTTVSAVVSPSQGYSERWAPCTTGRYTYSMYRWCQVAYITPTEICVEKRVAGNSPWFAGNR